MTLWEQLWKWIKELLEDIEKPTTTTTTTEAPITGSNVFLWKPDSESRPGAAVLYPCRIRQEDIKEPKKQNTIINGDSNQVYEHREGYANGNRVHVFLKSKGPQYGGPVTVRVNYADGSWEEWHVPNGAARYETHSPSRSSESEKVAKKILNAMREIIEIPEEEWTDKEII